MNREELELAVAQGAAAVGFVSHMPSGPGVISSEKIPCLILTEIFRQAKKSLIVKFAHQINSVTELGRHKSMIGRVGITRAFCV